MTWQQLAGAVLTAGLLSPSILQGQQTLPPVSYVCPMAEHAQVLEDRPGKCPLCQMVLVPARLDQAFACPMHPAVVGAKAARCPLDGRELLPVVVSLYWSCADQPQERFMDPGRCRNGAARVAVREPRAHGDHNPKHGGQLFMASNKWHHVEATLPAPGILRVFIYDNFTKPLASTPFTGRAVTRERFDAATRASVDLESFPLVPTRKGEWLEARVGLFTVPAKVTVKMRFDPRLPEDRFDFAFETFSKEPFAMPLESRGPDKAQAGAVRAPGARPRVRSTTAPAPAPPGPATVTPSSPAPMRTEAYTLRASDPLPGTVADLVAFLAERTQEIQSLVARGQLGAVYVPALLGKDAALALERQAASRLPNATRAEAGRATRRLVLAAWQLDAAGDLGDATKVSTALDAFTAAARTIQAAHATP